MLLLLLLHSKCFYHQCYTYNCTSEPSFIVRKSLSFLSRLFILYSYSSFSRIKKRRNDPRCWSSYVMIIIPFPVIHICLYSIYFSFSPFCSLSLSLSRPYYSFIPFFIGHSFYYYFLFLSFC